MQTGTDIKKYNLPVNDVEREHRNFPGYEKNQWYSLAELQAGAYAGNTETDSQTETSQDHRTKGEKGGGGYAGQQKSGKGGRPWKSSSPRKKGN